MPPTEAPQPYTDSYTDYQFRDMAALEKRVREYQEKLASMKEMTNIFLVALVSFYCVWIPFLFYEVMSWPEATWTALSIACTAAIALLMAYVFSISSKDKEAKSELYSRRIGVTPPQTQTQQLPDWMRAGAPNPPPNPPAYSYETTPAPYPAAPPPPPPPEQPPPLENQQPKVKGRKGPGDDYLSTLKRNEFGQFIPLEDE